MFECYLQVIQSSKEAGMRLEELGMKLEEERNEDGEDWKKGKSVVKLKCSPLER